MSSEPIAVPSDDKPLEVPSDNEPYIVERAALGPPDADSQIVGLPDKSSAPILPSPVVSTMER